MNTNQIDELSMIEERQKQLIAFWTSLESIRWRFVSAFGVGAVIGLFLLKSNKSSVEIQLISSFFIIFVSLASLVIQVRIFGLINSIWYKIVTLQELQFKLMDINNNISELTKKNQIALHFPPPTKKSASYLTVHMAICSIFVFFFCTGTYMIFNSYNIADIYKNSVITIIFFIGIFIVQQASDKYQLRLMNQKNINIST